VQKHRAETNTHYVRDPYCLCYIDSFSGEVSGNTTRGNVTRFIFVVLFVLSIMGLTFVSTTIIYNKKLQAHP
jgi:hypothetical protein